VRGRGKLGQCDPASESLGIAFTVPTPGDYRVCASFSVDVYVPAGSVFIQNDFKLVETPNDASTVVTAGRTQLRTGHNSVQQLSTFPVSLCDTFSWASAGEKTVRLEYVSNGTGGYFQLEAPLRWEAYVVSI
jgi:hypothetical protein